MTTTTKLKKHGTKIHVTATEPTTKRKVAVKSLKGGGGAKGGIVIMTGPQLMRWRQKRKIPRKLFAIMTDCSERTLASYEKAEKLPTKIKRPVTETIRLVRALQELAGDDTSLKDWLQKPNPAFGKKTPLSLVQSGESDRLWEMVYQLRLGAFA